MKTETLNISAYGRKTESDHNLTFPIVNLQCKYNGNINRAKYSLAVQELIIEWNDSQTEMCGYIHCDAIEDAISKNARSYHTKVDEDRKREQNMKELLCFVKPPGRKTSFIQIPTNELRFASLDMKKFKTHRTDRYQTDSFNHDVEISLKPLFDANEVLPIKHSHITVEIHIVH